MDYRKIFNTVRFRKKRYDAICELLEIKNSDTILDIGCGHGISFEIFNRTNQIIGMDLYDSYHASNYSYVKGDAENLPFEDKEFDVAVSIGCFEHIWPMEKLGKCIMEIDRVAKRGCALVPSISSLLEPHFQKFFWQLRPFEKRIKLSDKTLGVEKAGAHEKLNYLSDDAWLNFTGFENWSTKSYWHIFPLLKNLLIYKC
jgi:ubiquinone/menaquinone biosynthesis C-methylase UbiE